MELPHANHHKRLVMLAETLGTAILIIAVNYGSASGGTAPALAQFACCLMIGPVSNAHINPAVTIGVLINEGFTKDNILFTVLIWLSQFLGATLGVLFVRITTVVVSGNMMSPVAALAIDESYYEADCETDCKVFYGKIFMVEVFCTFMFVSCCLAMVHQGSREKPLNALAAGAALYMAI
jgi:glycerol uptake facilitator-like aquaporin